LYKGPEAVGEGEEYQTQLDSYHKTYDSYMRANAQYVIAYDTHLEKSGKGEKVDPPNPPVKPGLPIRQISHLEKGFINHLAGGQYEIRLRSESGTILQGGEKKVIVFAPRREGISYTLMPEAKWTTPDSSSTAGDVIYGEGNIVLYAQLFAAVEYNDLFY